ncbi:unnamed protein product [Brachionus calyciflorus]|uniref:Uncharacterized protein n=1 Tax=Brachionus calyciflorus TaxID=104777 RepID=A0A813YAZ5_9BILA|nr:unnamed protein product [Brachionus calyciflorus]
MISILKLFKSSKNKTNLCRNIIKTYSTESTETNHIAGHSLETNPESSPIKKLDSKILKTLGRKPIELPKLEEEFAKKIETITSLDFSQDALTWIHIKNNGKILDWNFVHFDKELMYHADFNIAFEYLNKLYEEKIPKESNAYIFEEKRYKARETKMFQYILKLQRGEIMLQSLLKSKILNQVDKKIFKMNSGKVAKKFNILVGNERVRASNLMQYMIKPKADFHLDFDKFILGDSDRFYDFFSRANDQKEPLAINYLQASCFLNLIRDFDTEFTEY